MYQCSLNLLQSSNRLTLLLHVLPDASGCAAPGQPAESLTAPPWHTPTPVSGHSHPAWVLTSTCPATASIWTGRADPSLGLLSFLPWLAVVQKGTCTTGNSSSSKQQLEFYPAIIYTDMMLTVHFRDFSQCCFRLPQSESPFPKRQTSAIPMPVKSMLSNSACQIFCRSFHLLLFNFSICKTEAVTLAFSVLLQLNALCGI